MSCLLMSAAGSDSRCDPRFALRCLHAACWRYGTRHAIEMHSSASDPSLALRYLYVPLLFTSCTYYTLLYIYIYIYTLVRYVQRSAAL